MPMTENTVIVDTPTLVSLNDRAVENHFNRKLSQAFLKQVDPDGSHIIAHTFIHADDHVRAIILVKTIKYVQPAHATLDMTIDAFLKLPRFAYNDAGDLVEVSRDGRDHDEPIIVVKREDRVSLT